jgi:hypothetical protein
MSLVADPPRTTVRRLQFKRQAIKSFQPQGFSAEYCSGSGSCVDVCSICWSCTGPTNADYSCKTIGSTQQ